MQWFHDLSFRWKVSLPLALISIIFIGSSILGIRVSTRIADNADKVGNVFLRQIDLLLQADRDLYQALVAEQTLVYIDSSNAELHGIHRENAEQVITRIKQALALGEIDDLSAFEDKFQKLYKSWLDASNRVITAVERGDISQAEKLSKNEAKESFDDLRNMIDIIQEKQITASETYTVKAIELSRDVNRQLLMSLIIGLIVVFLMMLIVPKLITPLLYIRQSVEGIASGNGDLTSRISLHSRDELGDLADKFNQFLDKMHYMVSNIKDCSLRVSHCSSDLSRVSSNNRHALELQSQALDMVVSAVHEMSTAIGEVARNTSRTADQAMNAQDLSMKGLNTVTKTVQQIQHVSDQVSGVSVLITEVEQQVANVTSVLDVIRGIAEQTNLLALNAAIEAARAGEQGRGFAVVADEVRTLASRTQDSTTDIQVMLEKLQSGVRGAVAAMKSSAESAIHSVDTANEAGQALNEINEAVATITDMTVQVAAAIEEQSVVIEDINKNLVQISDQAITTSESANKTDQAGKELDSASHDLMSNIGNFRLK